MAASASNYTDPVSFNLSNEKQTEQVTEQLARWLHNPDITAQSVAATIFDAIRHLPDDASRLIKMQKINEILVSLMTTTKVEKVALKANNAILLLGQYELKDDTLKSERKSAWKFYKSLPNKKLRK